MKTQEKPLTNEFGEKIREIRTEQKLSLRAAADKMGSHFTYLSKLERGEFPAPSADMIVRLADTYRIDADELFVLVKKVPADLQIVLSSDYDAIKTVRNALALYS